MAWCLASGHGKLRTQASDAKNPLSSVASRGKRQQRRPLVKSKAVVRLPSSTFSGYAEKEGNKVLCKQQSSHCSSPGRTTPPDSHKGLSKHRGQHCILVAQSQGWARPSSVTGRTPPGSWGPGSTQTALGWRGRTRGGEFQDKWEKPLPEAWRSHVQGARQPECRR